MSKKKPIRIEKYEDTPMHWLYFDDADFTVWQGRKRIVRYLGKPCKPGTPGKHNKDIRLTGEELARAEEKYDLSLNYGREVEFKIITFAY